jgi:maltooligosyltrehalose trehalohydrolase
LLLIAESGDNNPRVITAAADGGLGFGAQWNDDFHHSLHAVLTGERDGYYQDFGRLEQLAHSINDGFVFEGQYSRFRGRRHGVSSRNVPSDHFVNFAQNHDQIGNRAGGDRLTAIVEPAQCRLAAAVLLLTPGVPLLFMGEEYGETAPFPYFVDHSDPALLDAVRRGRAEEFGRDIDELDPASPETFAKSRLDWERRDSPEGKAALALYQALLDARRAHPVITEPAPLEHVAVVVGDMLTLRRRAAGEAMVAAFNFGEDATTLLMPPPGLKWVRVLDGDHLDTPTPVAEGRLHVPPHGFALCLATSPADGRRMESVR